MSDQSDLELEAASAAADDLASAEERALVDASQALRADVESFRGLTAQIAAIDVPSGARDAALAAALAVFDAGLQPASSAAVAPAAMSRSSVVSLESRRHRRWGLLVGAAAAVAVLAIGAVLFDSRGGDDEATSDTTAAAATVIPGSARTEKEESAGAPAAETDAPDVDEEAQPLEDATGQPAPPPAAAETTSLPLVIQTTAEVTPTIGNPSQLLSYASSPFTYSPSDTDPATDPATDQVADTTAETTAETTAATTVDPTVAAADTAPPAGDAANSGVTSPLPTDLCVSDDTEYIGQVRYQGVLAYVVRALGTDEVRALAADDCRLLASATP